MTHISPPHPSRRRRAILLSAAATIFLLPHPARATTSTWSSPVSGAWFTDSHWSPADVPDTLSDTALVSATGLGSYTLTIDGSNPFQLGTLTLTSPNATVRSTTHPQHIATADLFAGTLALSSAASLDTTHTGNINNFATLLFSPGAGGTRTLGPLSTLTNSGAVSVDAPTTLVNSVIHNNTAGTLSVSTGQSLSLTQGSRINQNPGSTLALAGSLSLNSGTFSFTGGAITGPGTVTLTDATLALGTSGSGGNFLLRGSGANLTRAAADGYILPSTSVTLERTDPAVPFTVSLPSTFTNAGALVARSSGDYDISFSPTTLINTGTLSLLPGPTGGGHRDLRSVTLKNTGSVYVGSDTTLAPGSTNSGSLTVAPGATLSLRTGSGTFTHAAGTLDIDGSFNLSPGQTFAYTGGAVLGTVTMNGGTVLLPNSPLPAASTTLLFRNSGTLVQTTSTFQILPGMSVIAEANPTYQSSASPKLTLQVSNFSSSLFSNTGSLTLRSAGADYDVELAGGSTFANRGSLLIEPGPTGGGNRILNTSTLVNTGTVAVNTNTTLQSTITNAGLITVAPGATLGFGFAGYSFAQTQGTLDIRGSLILTGHTFSYSDGAILGTVTLNGGTLVVPSGQRPSTAATFLFRNSGAVSGVLDAQTSPGMTLVAEANPTYQSTASPTLSLLTPISFTNAGTIILRSVGQDFDVTMGSGGTITNTGSILVQPGPTGTGARRLGLSLVNSGTLSVSAPNTSFTGSLTNTGLVSVGPGASLQGGPIIQSAGTLDIQGSLSTTGGFTLNGGSVLGTVTIIGGTLVLPSQPVANPGTYLFRSFGSLSQSIPAPSTAQIPPGMSVIAEANSTHQSTASPNLTLFLPSSSTFTNAGSITLRSVDASYNVTLSGSTLINVGSLALQPGPIAAPTAGGNRTLNLFSLQNSGGTIAVNSNTTATGNITNAGLITVAPGATLSQSPGNPWTFSQSAGLLSVQGALNITTGQFFNYTGGSVLGTVTLTGGTLSLPSNSTGLTGTFLYQRSGSLSGTFSPSIQIPARMSLIAEANPAHQNLTLSHFNYPTFSNAGSITLRSVGGNYNVTFGGDINGSSGRTLSNTGSIVVDPGPTPGAGLRFINYGLLLNAGTLTLNTSTRLDGFLINTGTLTLAPGVTLTSRIISTPDGVINFADTTARLQFVSRTPDQIRQQLLTGDLHATFPNPQSLLSLAYFPDQFGTIVLPALTGDTNLDGAIDPDDYALLDRSLAVSRTNPHWTDGDFNYDGAITAADYLLIDTAYLKARGLESVGSFLAHRQSQFGPTYVSDLLTSIPEPAPSSILYPVSSLLLTRRRKIRANQPRNAHSA